MLIKDQQLMCGDRQDHIKNDTEIYEEIYEDFYPPLMEI